LNVEIFSDKGFKEKYPCLFIFSKYYVIPMIRFFKRFLSLYEYESYSLLKKEGLEVPKYSVISDSNFSIETLKDFADELVVKAQVKCGGRGKGKFSSGLESGIIKTEKR
jgi:phosphoribosylaminoimidazole carboxylase (NCAIR synthetase)